MPPIPALQSVPAMPLENDPVPAEIRAVMDLFATHLAKVPFPDVDAASLRRLADELRTDLLAVERARETLDAAVAASEVRLAALTAAAGRAVAYARIYSEAEPERHAIAAAIAALAQPAPAGPTLTKSGKRRGRPPRQTAELFDATAPAAASDAPA